MISRADNLTPSLYFLRQSHKTGEWGEGDLGWRGWKSIVTGEVPEELSTPLQALHKGVHPNISFLPFCSLLQDFCEIHCEKYNKLTLGDTVIPCSDRCCSTRPLSSFLASSPAALPILHLLYNKYQSLFYFCTFAYAVPSARDALPPSPDPHSLDQELSSLNVFCDALWTATRHSPPN